MSKRFSPTYIEHRKQGPFPNRIDPWAELGRYFHQIHSGLIGHLLTQIQDPLIALGYEAGRETSLQVLEQRQPDIYVRDEDLRSAVASWDYPAVAQAISAEPGIAVDWNEPDLQAIYVRDFETGDLVAVVEIVSPSNKLDQQAIAEYRERRERTVKRGVNIVEVDATRSVKRLLGDALASAFAYHAAVYLPHRVPRVIGFEYDTPLKRIALPLRGEGVAMELQAAYDFAYQQASIAGQIYSENHYVERELPFPSLLTETQRREALQAVQGWSEALILFSRE